jgi:hypothetical protein
LRDDFGTNTVTRQDCNFHVLKTLFSAKDAKVTKKSLPSRFFASFADEKLIKQTTTALRPCAVLHTP